MDESIRKALEEKFNVKPKEEVKAPATEESLHVESETEVKESIADENINVDPELEKKILSFFESATSDKEIWQRLPDATAWLMEEKNYEDEEINVAWEEVCQVLEKNHIKVPEGGGWCSILILIAITSTLSLYFVM